MKRRVFYPLYLIVTTLLLSVAVEYAAMLHNRSVGARLPFLVAPRQEIPRFGKYALFNRLDPHLGFAHQPEVVKRPISTPHHLLPGFVVYQENDSQDADDLRIVTLGGSTTDPWMYGHSWPEELARLLAAAGIEAVVINGGVGGYSSNQELLKLIRDVLEIEPDIVLTYNGLNDAIGYAPWPTPMIHPYQRTLFRHTANPTRNSRLAPNAVHFVRQLVRRRDAGVVDVSYGVDTRRSAGEFTVRNIDVMRHVCDGMGVEYLAFVQPAVGVGEYRMTPRDVAVLERYGAGYLESLRAIYGAISEAASERSYIKDLRDIFFTHQGVYKEDGWHLTRKGNEVVAQAIMETLIENGLLPGALSRPDLPSGSRDSGQGSRLRRLHR